MAKRMPITSNTEGRKKILIVDDHPMMREGLRSVIEHEPDMIVCGVAENANQAMEAVPKLAPDLALVDITLPGKSGLELVKDLKAMHPRLTILAISMHDESLYAERMLRAGANGYITKQQPPEELVKAIRQVLDNRVYVSKEVSEKLLRRFSGQTMQIQSPVEILTDREFEVLELIGEGKSPKEISRQLHISGKTVAVHSANIRQKLNLKSSAQMIRFAVQSESFKTLTGD
ncbi:MAG: response regulator transcription factor [Verrucomicrobiales bacterium]|nr:response regulator transcription factor [Verrucomicrobiales bacterium]